MPMTLFSCEHHWSGFRNANEQGSGFGLRKVYSYVWADVMMIYRFMCTTGIGLIKKYFVVVLCCHFEGAATRPLPDLPTPASPILGGGGWYMSK